MGKWSKTVLVTGGSGYFGELLVQQLLNRGFDVRVLDLNLPTLKSPRLSYFPGDIRDKAIVNEACKGVSVVYHNIAQVPLAKDKKLFWSVNREGTRMILNGVVRTGVGKFIYTSSSAVYGVPKSNPVTELTEPEPAEDYGKAKLGGEIEVIDANKRHGLEYAIIRPRTILGHGRLGIMQILFDWILQGKDVPVFDGGNNVYQFVHADDLAEACILASERSASGVYNIGAENFGTMTELLQAVIRHSKSRSRIKSVPMGPTVQLMNLTSRLGISPLGSYHSLMYGRSMYFDITKAKAELKWKPRYSNAEMICESFDWYRANREKLMSRNLRSSHHRSAVKQGILRVVPEVLRLFPYAR